VGSASNPLTPTGPTFGHCGSGLFEVIDQVVNVSLISDLNALAQQFLNKSGAIPQIVTYETDKPGIFVGMGQTVYLPSLGIPRTGTTPLTFVVSQISGTAQTGPLGFGSWYRWTITLINNYDPANWIAYYSALIAGTENPLPVLTQQPYRWALGNGSSLAAGNSVTNPTQVLQTGLVTAFAIAAANPPVNQTLVVTILRNNIQIAQLVLTPSATPNVFITTQVPASNGLYLYLGDVLSLNVSYVAGTGTPVKAMNVTVCVYTSM